MCLALIAFAAHPRYRVAIAANRDEFYSRAATPASWISPDTFAGRDLLAGGTWLGLRRDGRYALLTNFRDPARNDARAPSRGALPMRALEHRGELREAMQDIASLDRSDNSQRSAMPRASSRSQIGAPSGDVSASSDRSSPSDISM